jgi:hypothetical protein
MDGETRGGNGVNSPAGISAPPRIKLRSFQIHEVNNTSGISAPPRIKLRTSKIHGVNSEIAISHFPL